MNRRITEDDKVLVKARLKRLDALDDIARDMGTDRAAISRLAMWWIYQGELVIDPPPA